MSSLIVEVCEVKKSEKHPNADRMSVVTVKGWTVCAGRDDVTGKNQFEPGELCVYIPPDSVLPRDLGERLAVTKYLQPLAKREDGTRPDGGRVRVASLRGVKSEGLIFKLDDPAWPLGFDVAGHYGITKWEPPIKHTAGDAAPEVPAFHAYYDMESIQNFPETFVEGEQVVVTEKLHGSNVRLGLIRMPCPEGCESLELMAGSHAVRRKVPEGNKVCRYWSCMTPEVKSLLLELSQENGRINNVVLFGEVYGSGVQDMAYGFENGRTGFRAFDVTVNGRYLDFDVKRELFERHGVDAVPVLWEGPYSFEKIAELAEGPTTICEPERAGKFKGREGVVVTSRFERCADYGTRRSSRAQLKFVSFAYKNRKGGSEEH